MSIHGNLATMELAELLQWVSQGRKTGTLVVADERVAKRIFFRGGKVIAAASTDPREHLGHFLVRHGMVDEEQLAAAVRRQERENKLLGVLLVDSGVLTAEELDAILRLRVEENIFQLFEWSQGNFRFLEGELPQQEMAPIALEVTGLVLEASRRQDEWQRIRTAIPSLDAVPVLVGDQPLADPSLEEPERRLLAAVDDDRTVAEIAAATRSSDFAVCEALYPQVRKKRIKMIRVRRADASAGEADAAPSAQALLDKGRQLLKLRHYSSGLRHLHAARSLDPQSAVIRQEVERAEAAIRRMLQDDGIVPTAVPRLTRPLEELAQLAVAPHAGFILSRIDGRYDVGSILKISPLPQLESLLAFWELLHAGHVSLGRRAP
ncbi:MAG TPA: DUF4388 domain-containing protein [Thermoanaerobaculia bacterium]|nr:DUF4388 domain-containing protein [Thermoanaerobaculia bacterium]